MTDPQQPYTLPSRLKANSASQNWSKSMIALTLKQNE
jgi:hypothetical protein